MLTSVIARDSALLEGTAYRFEQLIARGPMSTVVVARRRSDEGAVVIKLLEGEARQDLQLADRLRVEAEVLRRLEHPNLVRVLDFGTTPAGAPFLAMELLSGRTLRDELEARGQLPVPEALELIRQALAALAVAHARGLVHRDVKPANLFVCESGLLKVLDFGIAKVLGEAELSGIAPKFRTQDGVRLGTPRYIAPEQVRGGLVTPATDVYAAGLVLYRMLTGKHPFAQYQGVEELYRAQLLEMPPPPSTLASQAIPPELDRVVLRAIAKAPADRFADASAFSAELARAGAASNAVDSRAAPTLAGAETVAVTGEPAPEPVSRRREVVATLALLAAGLDLAWRVIAGLDSLRALIDPLAAARSLVAPTPLSEVESLELVGRGAAALDLARAGLLGALNVSLMLIALRLLQKQPRAERALRSWSFFALAAVVIALVLDVGALALRGVMLSKLSPSDDTQATVLGAVYVATMAAAIAVPLAQLTGIVLLRRFGLRT